MDTHPIPNRATPDHTAILRRGLRWLYDVRQPRAAVLVHHGVTLLAATRDNRSYTWVPAGAAGTPVLVVAVTRVDHDDRGLPTNPLRTGELDALVGALAHLGAVPVETWHGHRGAGATGSVRLGRPAHPTLLAAVDRYLAACHEHGHECVDAGCSWYARGRDRIRGADPIPGGRRRAEGPRRVGVVGAGPVPA